jgi:pyruvate/2-oxoglutarate dehydrogenase complex dihydrolipoamide acyltransferase (E2) component
VPAPAVAEGAGELARLVRKAVAEGRRAEITVSLRTPDDADRFARHVAEASSDPEVKAAILAAAVRFVPVGPQPSAAASHPASTGPAPAASAYEMTSGVLTEAKLVEVARTHRRIALGAAVVLTPLARDKAREMKIELTRQKP